MGASIEGLPPWRACPSWASDGRSAGERDVARLLQRAGVPRTNNAAGPGEDAGGDEGTAVHHRSQCAIGAPTTQSTNRDLSPRAVRALMALVAAPVTREQLDRAAGCSNSPDLVMGLRRDLGLTIPCRREAVFDRDGCSVQRGRYRLTSADKAVARRILRGGQLAAQARAVNQQQPSQRGAA